MFSCVEIDGEYYLVADMRLRCCDAEWFGYALWALGMIAVYTVGLPAGITYVLWRNRRRLEEPDTKRRLAFLYVEYGSATPYGEPAELLRKLLLTSLALFFSPNDPLQLLYAILVSFAAAVGHAALKPFAHSRRAYWLQHLSLWATFCLFVMGLLYKVEGLDTDTPAFQALTYALVVVCGGFILIGFALIAVEVTRQIAAIAHRKEVISTLWRARGLTAPDSAPVPTPNPAHDGAGGDVGPGALQRASWHSNPMHRGGAASTATAATAPPAAAPRQRPSLGANGRGRGHRPSQTRPGRASAARAQSPLSRPARVGSAAGVELRPLRLDGPGSPTRSPAERQ